MLKLLMIFLLCYMTDVSTYWVNYVSLKGLGVIVDLAQIFVLLTVTLRFVI